MGSSDIFEGENMNKILAALAIVTMSIVASARSIDRTPVVAVVSGQEAGIKQIALLADGRMQIVSKDDKMNTIQISQTALNRLTRSAMELSFAEVKTETRMFVCEVMPVPSLSKLAIGSFNTEARGFEGNQTKVVLTAQGCEQLSVTAPTESYNMEAAAQLREAMIILALNSLK